VDDKWDWSLDLNKGYSVLVAYHLFSSIMQSDRWDHYATVWNKIVSLKVLLLVWKMLLNRLPTKDNLIHHEIIPHTSYICSSGCDQTENADNLFTIFLFLASFWRTSDCGLLYSRQTDYLFIIMFVILQI